MADATLTFLLGLYQRARCANAAVPLKDIDLEADTFRIGKRSTKSLTKGDKPFTQPIDARLLPTMKEIVKSRRAIGHKTLW